MFIIYYTYKINKAIIINQRSRCNFMMSQIKIQPWDNQINEDIGYVKKLNTLSNFKTYSNLKKVSTKKNYFQSQTFNKPDKPTKVNSVQTTMQNFHKTNRQSYKHRITKLVFSQQPNKRKIKFQPEIITDKYHRKAFSPSKYFKEVNQQNNRSMLKQQKLRKNKRQIYYNLTQANSPLNSILRTKCLTQQTQQLQNPKIKIFQKIRKQRLKKSENLPVFRELSIQRKIYILQSGTRSQKFLQRQTILNSMKNLKKNKNMISQICKYEREYERIHKNQQ